VHARQFLDMRREVEAFTIHCLTPHRLLPANQSRGIVDKHEIVRELDDDIVGELILHDDISEHAGSREERGTLTAPLQETSYGCAAGGTGGDRREALLRKTARVLNHHDAAQTCQSPAIQPQRLMITPRPRRPQA
jgi:hypothetical protein